MCSSDLSLHFRAGAHGLAVSVRSIEPRPATEVYDLTVADDHSFVADGVFTHNCNLHISRSGIVTVVALGAANHAGSGSGTVLAETQRGVAPRATAAARGLRDTTVGNSYYIGIEVENDGVGEPWSPQLVDAVTRAVTALCRMYGWPAEHIIRHAEWTARKSDTTFRGWRTLAAARLAGQPAPHVDRQTGDRYLRLGSTGKRVVALQRTLGVAADGDFGPLTEDALKRWQAAAGLDADGVVGPKTRAALKRTDPEAHPVEQYLQAGSKGSTVKALQRKLGIKPATGEFDAHTEEAVRRWQQHVGLVPDGVIGPLSLAELARFRTPLTDAEKAAARKADERLKPAPRLPSWWQRTLRKGSVGKDVKAVQREVGADDDGRFGALTEARVRRWQAAHGLEDDGIVGPLTAKAMG